MIKRDSLLFPLLLVLISVFTVPLYASPSDFICGGTAYDWLGMRDLGGYWDTTDPLGVLSENGVNYNRIGVLIKHHPTGYPESWCSIEYADEVIQSTLDNGMKVNLFFYLSDTAAHAGQQPVLSHG